MSRQTHVLANSVRLGRQLVRLPWFAGAASTLFGAAFGRLGLLLSLRAAAALGLVCGIAAMLVALFRQIARRRAVDAVAIADLTAATIATIEGWVVAREPMVSPSGRPCVYYQHRLLVPDRPRETAEVRPFALDDGSGVVEVDPRGARVRIGTDRGDRRARGHTASRHEYEELWISPGDCVVLKGRVRGGRGHERLHFSSGPDDTVQIQLGRGPALGLAAAAPASPWAAMADRWARPLRWLGAGIVVAGITAVTRLLVHGGGR